MKKFILFLMLCFTSFVMSAQIVEVSEEQWSLFSKKTASWCPNCGTWGWQFMEGVIDGAEDDRTIILNTHFSGDLENETSVAINANFGGSGQPVFYLNGDDLGITSGNASSKIDETIESIGLLNGFSAFAGLGIDAFINADGALAANVSIKYLGNFTGKFSLALYILEDGVINNQSGQGATASHPYVVRSTYSGDAFGNLIKEGDATVGEIQDFELLSSNQIDNANAENFKVAAILWNEGPSGNQIFFNGNIDGDIQSLSNTSNPSLTNYSLKLMHDASAQQINLLNGSEALNVDQISLLSADGKVISSKSNITLNQGLNSSFSTQNLVAGTYLLNLQIDGKQITEKLFVK